MNVVWRLISGFLRRSWKGTLVLALMVFLMSSLLAADWRDQRGWAWFDLARLFVIVLVLAGRFFSGREVVSLPVSRRDLWRARWMLAALGIPAVAEMSRLAFRILLYRHLVVPIDWRSDGIRAGVDVLTGSACMGCAAVLLWPFVGVRQWVRQTVRWTAFVIGASLPIWCPYVRNWFLSGGATLTPLAVVFVILLVVLGVFGFVATPPVYIVEGHRIGAWAERRGPSAQAEEWRPAASWVRPGAGVRAWVWGEIGRALLAGGIAVIGTAITNAVGFLDANAGWRIGAAGVFLPQHAGAVMTAATVALASVGIVSRKTSVLRQLPLSAWTFVIVLTGGLLVTFASSWALEAVAFRLIFHVWPASAPFEELAALLVIAALAKTVAFVVDAPIVVILFGFVLGLRAAGGGLPLAVAPTPAILVALGVTAALMRVDLALLARARRLYHPRSAVA